MYCKYCNRELSSEEKFCPECGNAINESEHRISSNNFYLAISVVVALFSIFMLFQKWFRGTILDFSIKGSIYQSFSIVNKVKEIAGDISGGRSIQVVYATILLLLVLCILSTILFGIHVIKSLFGTRQGTFYLKWGFNLTILLVVLSILIMIIIYERIDSISYGLLGSMISLTLTPYIIGAIALFGRIYLIRKIKNEINAENETKLTNLKVYTSPVLLGVIAFSVVLCVFVIFVNKDKDLTGVSSEILNTISGEDTNNKPNKVITANLVFGIGDYSKPSDKDINTTIKVIKNRLNHKGIKNSELNFNETTQTLELKLKTRLFSKKKDVEDLFKYIAKPYILTIEEIDKDKKDSNGNYLPIDIPDQRKSIICSAGSNFSYKKNGLTENQKILIKLDSDNKKELKEITTNPKNKELAVFLDKEFLSNYTIDNPVNDGKFTFIVNLDESQSKELVDNLNMGSIPTGINIFVKKYVIQYID